MLIQDAGYLRGVAILTLASSRLDGACADTFREELGARLGKRGALVIDLQAVSFVDSMGLGALLFVTRKAAHAGADLVLCGLRPNVRALIGMVRMDKVLRIATDSAEAVEQLLAERGT